MEITNSHAMEFWHFLISEYYSINHANVISKVFLFDSYNVKLKVLEIYFVLDYLPLLNLVTGLL